MTNQLTEQEYIAKAVDLADGFEMSTAYIYMTPIREGKQIELMPQMHKDALAAQLVRQVHRLKPSPRVGPTVISLYDEVLVCEGGDLLKSLSRASGPCQSKNQIHAIVDSKVLEKNYE